MWCGPNAKILNIRYSVSWTQLIQFYYTTLERSCGFIADPLRACWILRISCRPVGSCGSVLRIYCTGPRRILRIYCGSTAGLLDLADLYRGSTAGLFDLAYLYCGSTAGSHRILRIYRGSTAAYKLNSYAQHVSNNF